MPGSVKWDIASSFSGSGSSSETKTKKKWIVITSIKKVSLGVTYNEGSEEADYRWNHLRYPFFSCKGRSEGSKKR